MPFEPAPAVEFSGEAVAVHREALESLWPRVTGSRRAEQARGVLRAALDRIGVTHHEFRALASTRRGEVLEVTHVLASIPGHSNDAILLAAHYDSPPPSASAAAPTSRTRDWASGAAFLLELARVLRSGETPRYTYWLAFIDGDAAFDEERRIDLGTRSLAEDWARSGELASIRAAFFFGALGDPGRPILRDIDSPRVYRELFWEAAREISGAYAFAEESPYGRSATGRTSFSEIAGRAAVAIERAATESLPIEAPTPRALPVDGAAVASDESEPSAARPAATAAESFEALGRVTLEALRRAAAKLHRIDRFARAPLQAGRDPLEPPAARP